MEKFDYTKKEFCEKFPASEIEDFFKHLDRKTSITNGPNFYKHWGIPEALVREPHRKHFYEIPVVKGNTYSGTYLAPLENHLIPFFGSFYMDEIKHLHVQRFINESAKEHGFETIAKDINCLRLICDTAVDNQLCTKSPLTKSIKLPKREEKVAKKAYTQEQYDIAYAFAKEWDGGLPIMTLMELGISRSELLGIRHEDLDREKRCIHINQGLVVYHSDDLDQQVMESDGLKNKFRRRSIPVMDDDLWNRLCNVPKTVTVGNEEILTEQLFHSPEGKPYNPNNWVNRVYRPFRVYPKFCVNTAER